MKCIDKEDQQMREQNIGISKIYIPKERLTHPTGITCEHICRLQVWNHFDTWNPCYHTYSSNQVCLARFYNITPTPELQSVYWLGPLFSHQRIWQEKINRIRRIEQGARCKKQSISHIRGGEAGTIIITETLEFLFYHLLQNFHDQM